MWGLQSPLIKELPSLKRAMTPSPATSADPPGQAHDAITLESLLPDLSPSPLTILSATTCLERSLKVQAHSLLRPQQNKIVVFPLTFLFFPGGSKVEDSPITGRSTFWDSLKCWWIQLPWEQHGGCAFPSFPQQGEQLSRDVVPSEQLTHTRVNGFIHSQAGKTLSQP